MRLVGSLACQRDPWLRTLVTKIVSWSAVTDEKDIAATTKSTKSSNSKQSSPTVPPSSVAYYDVLCEDSVLFPEGGGQPGDHGLLGGLDVVSVQRKGNDCVVRVAVPEGKTVLSVGDEVEQVVDWERRLDHTVHHTAQHLLTAIVERELGHPTEAWGLTHPACYIQLPVAKVSDEDIHRVESICNEYIAKSAPVTCTTYPSKDAIPQARSRGIPADVTGEIRIITLEEGGEGGDGGEIDSCTCCGTHVTSLASLGAIHLLHQEAKGNTVRLFFVVGPRAVKQFRQMYIRDKALTKALAVQSDAVPDAVAKVQTDNKQNEKLLKNLYAELVTMLVPVVSADAAAFFEQPIEKIQQKDSKGRKIFLYHREDANMDFLIKLSGTANLPKGPATGIQALLNARCESAAAAATATATAEAEDVAVLAGGSLHSATDGPFVVLTADPKLAIEIAESLVNPALGNAKGNSIKGVYRGKADITKWKAFVKSFKPAKEFKSKKQTENQA